MSDSYESKVVHCNRGHRGRKVMPYSGVCLHMQIAGQELDFEVRESGMVQLYREDGSHLSFPITSGEAGLFHNVAGGEFEFYYYVEEGRELVRP